VIHIAMTAVRKHEIASQRRYDQPAANAADQPRVEDSGWWAEL
jgi:hypothetical protein